jgi:plasmid stabilization system protein ParE
MKDVFWTNIARESLFDTSEFIKRTWGNEIFEKFLDNLDYRISQIQLNPEMAPNFENSAIRRMFIHKHVSLFYSNNDSYLKILLVWDNRQDPNKLLETLSI